MRNPDREEVRALAVQAGFRLDEREVDAFVELMASQIETLEEFEALSEPAPDTFPAVRAVGARASREEDPLNAVIRHVRVTGAGEGVLAGKRIGLKDLIAVAGVPMTCGSRVLQGFVPDEDSVLTRRLLEAGGEIVAMLNMDDMAFSGGGETSAFGAIRNPFDTGRTASGSSGGSAAALAYDGIDITYGTDQGGSIRLPAAWCGVLGLKPTYGLVPYTGIVPLDRAFDHVGPLATTAEDLARGLEAVAGFDPSDPRQQPGFTAGGYVDAVRRAPESFAGLRVGVLAEGFPAARPDSPPGTAETNGAVRGVIDQLAAAGARITDVSIPEHALGRQMNFVALVEGASAMLAAHGNGYHAKGRYDVALARALGPALKASGSELPPTVKLTGMLGAYMRNEHFGSLYGRAMNLAPRITDAFDRAFADVDVLVMPTATHTAHKAAPDVGLAEHVLRGWTMLANSPSTNVSGHPAISIPAAVADGLPVGVQFVAPHFADDRLISVAATWEALHGWHPLPTISPTRLTKEQR
ncbi:amidase family protein [Actinomadura sp. B10D3]|uniref:amidase family protein n=1 Tax=Actinomadura sp. B10D3 TaxID=3153557 RepID=UPI00325DB398